MLKQCFTPRFDGEEFTDQESLTVHAEKLDIRSMLQRAANGILDLQQFARPETYDFQGDGSENDWKASNALLDRDASVLDRTFGASFEEAIAERDRYIETAKQNRVPKSDPTPAPEVPKVEKPHDQPVE